MDDREGGRNTTIQGQMMGKKTKNPAKKKKTTLPKHKLRIGE